ncbi:MAG: YbjN domain-containing protein [Planctomycetota bacterium]
MSDSKPDRRNGMDGFKRVKKVLAALGWKPTDTPLEGALSVDLSATGSPIEDAIVQVKIDYERFVFYLNFRDRAPKKHRTQTMEFVTRANLDMVIGNFELDLDDGLLRFKSSLDFTGVKLEEALVRNAIRCATDVVEIYAEEAVAVMKGEKTANEAIASTES